MMKRKIHQSSHPFDACPFEIFSRGSWRPVECLQIKAGSVTTIVVDDGDEFEEKVLISNLRISSRRATLSDCTCFLRPGLDVCVFMLSPLTEDSCEEEEEVKIIWLDAKIKTIKRKHHVTGCACEFSVSFHGPRVPHEKKDIKVSIDRISIIQKLDRSPRLNEFFRWEFSQDCTSLQESMLYPGKFSSDISWAVAASILKQMSFNIRIIQKRIVYQIMEYDHDEIFLNSEDKLVSLNFKVENGISIPVVFAFFPSDILGGETNCDIDEKGPLSIYNLLGLRRSKRQNIQPDRYLGSDFPRICSSKFQNDRYKKYQGEYEETLEEHENEEGKVFLNEKMLNDDFIKSKRGTKSKENTSSSFIHENVTLPYLVEGASRLKPVPFEKNSALQTRNKSREKLNLDNQKEDRSQGEDTGNYGEEIDETYSRSILEKVNLANSRIGRKLKGSYNKWKDTSEEDFIDAISGSRSKTKYKKFHAKSFSSNYSAGGSFFGSGMRESRSFSGRLFNEMMNKCVENIKSTIDKEQPLAIDQWIEIQKANSLNRHDCIDSLSLTIDEEKSEIDMLWNEMELCIASTYLLENTKVAGTVPQGTSEGSIHICEHEYKLNEEIGYLCQFCGHVDQEIKDISPKFLQRSSWTFEKSSLYQGDSYHKLDDENTGLLGLFSLNTSSITPLSEDENNVWSLIPNLRAKLRFHQKKAFEFLWRNIAGSLIPPLMQTMVKNRGGCVISHSPGAGKTLLIIAFLESYLKLFPGSRPLVLAPKTTLYTWYKETTKWEISFPVYQIHSSSTLRGEASIRVSLKGPKPSLECMHILDCMEKIQKWVANPSVLIMSYSSFLTLTHEDTNLSYKQYMSRVLRQNTGMLVLDEGHNPRSTRSRLRKALMRVNTGLRILLSGTLFQNNFGEYFNTLTLARPSFVNEVLRVLDPNSKKRKKGVTTRLSLENRARKFFLDKIAKKINSSLFQERSLGLNTLRNLTSGFIDVYEGANSDNLPGIQSYTLMMKSTSFQQKLLVKIQSKKPQHSGFPLEQGSLVTLGSIHPFLIQTSAYASHYFNRKELEKIEKCKLELKLGPKVRFVMSILPRCIMRDEKVLIFCHNIAPIKLFVEIFESVFQWKKGKDILVLTGDLELFERGRIMDKFEEKGGNSKVMLASITACSEGISLTAASRLILLDSAWNPSRTKQAIARAYRPGQEKVVYVFHLLAKGTLEEDKYVKTTWKEWVSSVMFSDDEVLVDPAKMEVEKIKDEILREIVEEDGASLFHEIMWNEKGSDGKQ